MEVLFSIVMIFVNIYKFLHLMVVKLLTRHLRSLFMTVCKRKGINVVLSLDGKKNQNNLDFSSNLIVDDDSKSKLTKGKNPTITIYNEKFFERIFHDRTLGIGESFMEGWWDCDMLSQVTAKFATKRMVNSGRFLMDKFVHYLEYNLFNLQTSKLAKRVADQHYDMGNHFFEACLGPTMNYSCGYWKNAKNLEEAQINKMELVARKLKLKPGMRVLDIGCGWGSLAQHLATNYQVSVVAITISKEGMAYAQNRCKGLPVEFRCVDYRQMDEKFDRVVSLGMMEHVGPKNYDEYMKVAHRCLNKNGIFLIQTMGCDDDGYVRDDPFSSKYIFINGAFPRSVEIAKSAAKYFTMEDWHNFGYDYSRTAKVWCQNFIHNWPKIQHRFKEPLKFYRMWTFYLASATGLFASRKFQLWQIVLSKDGIQGGYESER